MFTTEGLLSLMSLFFVYYLRKIVNHDWSTEALNSSEQLNVFSYDPKLLPDWPLRDADTLPSSQWTWSLIRTNAMVTSQIGFSLNQTSIWGSCHIFRHTSQHTHIGTQQSFGHKVRKSTIQIQKFASWFIRSITHFVFHQSLLRNTSI